MASKSFFEIPYYHDYVSPDLARHLLAKAQTVAGIDGLVEVGHGGGLETKPALEFLVELYKEIKDELRQVLEQRRIDRKFIDERVKATFEFNQSFGRDILDPDYQTILGLQDGNGRVVIGPLSKNFSRAGGAPVAPLPEFLKGPHVTLFGPPDSAKMAINAMNAYHRKLPGEPAIVEELIGGVSPMWGADDEDSKTPLHQDLVDAAVNLTACFDGSLSLKEAGKSYDLASDHLALPIKRFPGLALPSTFLFYRENPIPLHLYDFALHLFRNWKNPHALVFYVPKLENEEEAAYIHSMIAAAERRIKHLNPSYQEGSVRLMIVLENPRAILRAHEIMDALHPYFAGASLGWHDYLASTARVFKEDGNYRIPVKADPGIVIKYIKGSHHLLAETVGSRGGVRVGGMYGILPLSGHSRSLQITLKGFIKDVVTQLKRKLTGFWVAHPDFVRLGLALVEGFRQYEAGDTKPLHTLVTALLDPEFHSEILSFIDGPDIEGLDTSDPGYVRALLVADIKESDFIANNHPDEIRYNVFQSLQYLADWLSGNGCVALPTHVEGVHVRVMDDLATAERSRWEVWHELRHGRFAVEDFLKIAHEEMTFIRRDLSNDQKIAQVKWDDRTAKWYPVAFKIMLQLMTDLNPVEFATELLMPFTVDEIRSSEDPWAEVQKLDPAKFRLPRYTADYDHFFEICGVARFAKVMAQNAVEDLALAKKTILSFSLDEIKEAARFHGNIGDNVKVLDARAAGEQSLVLNEAQTIKDELTRLGETYLSKFGVKFLISAQGQTAAFMKSELERRLNSTLTEEIANARNALWEISLKRMGSAGSTLAKIETLRQKHGVASASFAINYEGHIQNLTLGSCDAETTFEIASLSKTIASAFALEYFKTKGLPLSISVNSLLSRTSSPFRLKSAPGADPGWADQVQLSHLMNHTALNMHYVKGFPAKSEMPKASELICGQHGYEPIAVISKPGQSFHYSGGGFLVLEHLISALEDHKIEDLTAPFLKNLGLKNLTFDRNQTTCVRELDFPAFAAGAFGTSSDTAKFLNHVTTAFHDLDGSGGISHDTAVTMLHGIDRGARAFMGCDIGLGVFTAEAGQNRLMIHQGANEGFRSLFVQCYRGPDRGKGLVLFCTGDNNAVPFLAEAAREIINALDIRGVDFSKVQKAFETSGLAQEQIVNVGYKSLLFDAFLPDLPEEIVVKGPKDPLAEFNLATRGKVVAVNNQRFARSENLISDHLPIFDPELFGNQGKVMDSWESSRHNQDAYDLLTLKLEKPSKLQFVSFSTKYHDGNHAAAVRLEGKNPEGEWVEIVPKTPFQGHALMQLKLAVPQSEALYSHVRLEMHPDGGISRLGLYAALPPKVAAGFSLNPTCVRFDEAIPKSSKPLTIPYRPTPADVKKNQSKARAIDWASAANGGSVVRASNEHYGPAAQVISPYPPIHMFDGLESARSRDANHFEEVDIRLGKPIQIGRVELDFKFFVNNNPREVSIEGWDGKTWQELQPKTPVKAFAGNKKRFEIQNASTFEQVRLKVYPDGGVHRIKVYEPSPLGLTSGR